MYALPARLMKDGMARNAPALLDSSRLTELASPVTLTLTTLVRIVPAISDSTAVEEANATSATAHAVNALVPKRMNA